MNSLAGIDMGRILLDLSNEVIKQLDDLEVQRNLPRADLLREAVDQYLINQSQTYSAAIFLIPICISFDTAEKRRYATYLILNRRFSFEF
ncbi:hypothetical protein CER41_003415 [Escherichia coli]|nr:hypothetical protein [Escherichia coli]